MTYREYLRKYYGDSVRHRPEEGDVPESDHETSYLSDGCVDYDADHRYHLP